MHNPKAIFSVFFGLVALAALGGGVGAARYYEEVGLVEVGIAVGIAGLIDGGAQALIEVIAYGFVIWVLATSGSSFRRG